MTKPSLSWLLVLVGSLLLACGGPHAGGTCSKAGYLCLDQGNALECRGGKWVQLPCRGAQGCVQTSDHVTCDLSANQAGDACASAQEGAGLCGTNGQAVYGCRDGVLVQTNTCTACSVSSGQVVCQH